VVGAIALRWRVNSTHTRRARCRGVYSVHVGLVRRVDVRLPGKGNSNSRGARPVHLIITMIKWIRTSRLSIKNSLSVGLRWAVLNLRTATSQKCAAVPRRARI